jgi:hypothetical protein
MSKRPSKLDRLMTQGRWVEANLDGYKLPYFAMPTPELQTELNEELEKKIRKQLKAAGFERICATRRDHPFHSAILRERVDILMDRYGNKTYRKPESIEAERQDLYEFARETQQQFTAPQDAWKRFTER